MCKSVERKKTRFGVDLIHLRGFLVHVKIIRKAADQCRLVAVFCDVISRLRTTLATAKKNVGHVMQIIFRATCRPEPRVGHVMHCIGQVPESVTWYSRVGHVDSLATRPREGKRKARCRRVHAFRRFNIFSAVVCSTSPTHASAVNARFAEDNSANVFGRDIRP
jgi:hypothetical protein